MRNKKFLLSLEVILEKVIVLRLVPVTPIKRLGYNVKKLIQEFLSEQKK